MEETNKEKNGVDKLKSQASQVANSLMNSKISEKIKNRGNSAFQKLWKWQLNNWKNGSNLGKAKVIGLNLIVLLVLGNVFLSGASTPQKNHTSVAENTMDSLTEAISENNFTVVKANSYICFSLSSYKILIDNIDGESSSEPQKCHKFGKTLKFFSTKEKETYKGKTMVKLSGVDGESLWAGENDIL